MVQVGNSAGRAVTFYNGQWFDLADVSGGLFSSDPMAVVSEHARLREWASSMDFSRATPVVPDLYSPVPYPRQIVAIGLNYRDHALESGASIPEYPVVFTKFQSSLAGPFHDLHIGSDTIDWEAELVVVMGEETHKEAPESALATVAGFMVGQDFSDRAIQFRGPLPQFSLAKSFPGFSPVGPAWVSLDEFRDANDLAIRTTLIKTDGTEEVVQESRTGELIFDVSTLVSALSGVMTLFPGDLIFTGTPAGVGLGRDPKRFLQAGWRVVTEIEGIGRLENLICG